MRITGIDTYRGRGLTIATNNADGIFVSDHRYLPEHGVACDPNKRLGRGDIVLGQFAIISMPIAVAENIYTSYIEPTDEVVSLASKWLAQYVSRNSQSGVYALKNSARIYNQIEPGEKQIFASNSFWESVRLPNDAPGYSALPHQSAQV